MLHCAAGGAPSRQFASTNPTLAHTVTYATEHRGCAAVSKNPGRWPKCREAEGVGPASAGNTYCRGDFGTPPGNRPIARSLTTTYNLRFRLAPPEAAGSRRAWLLENPTPSKLW